MPPALGYRFLRKVVSNDAMKADPPKIYGGVLLWLNLAASLGAMTVGMHGSLLGSAIGTMAFMNRFNYGRSTVHWYATFSANIATTYTMAGFAGALLSILIADRFGRRLALLIAAVVILVGDIIECSAWGKIVVLYIGRFISGLGLGVCSSVVPIYIAEHSPRAIRGLATSTYYLFQHLGHWLGFWIAYGTRQHVSRSSDAQWILPLAMQTLPTIMFILALSFCPETPRFLASRGDNKTACTILARVRRLDHEDDYVKSELKGIGLQLEAPSRHMSKIGRLFKIPSNRRRLLVATGLMVAQSLSGYYSASYDWNRFFLAAHWTSYKITMYTSVLNGILEILSCIIFTLFVVDAFGRRKSLLWMIPIQMTCLFAVGVLSAVWHNLVWPAAENVFYVELPFIYLCNCVFQFGLGPVPIIYVVEIPSTQMRAVTAGIAVAVQWLFQMGLARALPYMLFYIGQTGNGFGTHFIFGACCLGIFPFVWYLIPETKGLSLEDMDSLFGQIRTDHSEDDSRRTSDASNVVLAAKESRP